MNKIVLVLTITGICLIGTDAFAIVGIDSYTTLMLHANGADGSTNFVDSSFSNHTVTTYGNTQIDTAESKFGGASALFDGDGDYLSIPDSDDWYFGTGDFTIDFWVRFNSISSNQVMLMQKTDFDNYVITYCSTANEIRLRDHTGGPGTIEAFATWSPSVSTWYHLALVRNSDDWDWYRDGTQLPTGVKGGTGSIGDYTGPLYIGYSDAPEYGYLNGWLDELRISKGIARWTSDFTPPTEEYTLVPEPSTLVLLALSLLGGGLFKRKKS